MKEKLTYLSAEAGYIEGLARGNSDDVSISNLKGILDLGQDKQNRIVIDLVSSINRYKINRNNSSPRVKVAWSVIEKFFSDKNAFLKRENLIPLVYGSVVFDDPCNLDYDLVLVSESQREVEDIIQVQWVDEMEDLWKKVGNGGHFSYVSLDKIKMDCNAFNHGWSKYVREYAEMIDVDFLNASIYFTGELAIPDNESLTKVNYLKETLFGFAQKTPILMATIINCLQHTIVTREIRRNSLAPHQVSELYK